VDDLDGSAVSGPTLRGLSIAPDNPFMRVSGDFVVDPARVSVIMYLGLNREIHLDSQIEMIRTGGFYGHETLATVTFGFDSRLRIIEHHAFFTSGLRSICIPRTVEVIGREAFSCCGQLTSVVFESDSRLRRIERSAFFLSSKLTSICIPESIEELGDGWHFGTWFREIVFESLDPIRRMVAENRFRMPGHPLSFVAHSVDVEPPEGGDQELVPGYTATLETPGLLRFTRIPEARTGTD
jgi:hypothetical protein